MVFFQCLSAGGLNGEACELGGHIYFHECRSQNVDKQFPLTAKCNAEYDLVPQWISPVLAVLAILTVELFGAMLAALFTRFMIRAIKDT